jgi:GYF domain 2
VLEWYYQCADGEAYGPVSAPEMAKLERAGHVHSNTLVLRTDGTEWVHWETETAVKAYGSGENTGSKDAKAGDVLRQDDQMRLGIFMVIVVVALLVWAWLAGVTSRLG